jgi:hypothetical protein
VTVFSFMDRSFEDIRAEVLEMDRESQERLIEEIEQNLAGSNEPIAEAKRRAEAVDRGEMKTVDGPEALARVRKLIER